MSRMNDLGMLLDALVQNSMEIAKAAEELKKLFSEENAVLPEAKEETQKPVSFSDIRAKLAQKSREGFTAEIKEILRKYGAEKLSAVRPDDYASVLKEVEELSHE